MKKKVMTAVLAAALAGVALVGGTLAYFTDTDQATNTFTTGKVDITLKEDFTQDSKLLPGIDVKKEVYVTNNTGSETAYVRVHVAFPAVVDDGLPGLEAFKNKLHWNFTKEGVAEGKWSQLQNATQVGPNADYPGWPGNGGTYNTYVATIDNVVYNVYVMTYETALGAGETTPVPAINKVYLDTKITSDDLTDTILPQCGGQIKVLVFAEGGQAAGFDDAYTALNEQFGDPMKTGYVDPWNKAAQA